MAKFHNVNGLAAAPEDVMYSVMSVLLSAGWTHVASSDATTFSTVSNQITTAADLGNNSAFIILQDPGGRRQYAFQRTNGTGSTWNVRYSALDGFVTGGDATNMPTAADDAEVRNGGFFSDTADLRYHVVAESTPIGDVYPFWFAAWDRATNPSNSCTFIIDAMLPGSFPAEASPATPSTGDADPCVMIGFNNGVPAQVGASANQIGASNTIWRSWYKYNYVGELFVPMTGYPFGGSSEVFDSLPVNPYTDKVDLLPFYWGRATSDFASELGHKGIGAWIKWPGRAREYGEVLGLDTNAYFHHNDILLPWPENIVPLK